MKGFNSERKRCKIGLSCGASCISRAFECLKDFPEVVQGIIRKGVDFIKGRERIKSPVVGITEKPEELRIPDSIKGSPKISEFYDNNGGPNQNGIVRLGESIRGNVPISKSIIDRTPTSTNPNQILEFKSPYNSARSQLILERSINRDLIEYVKKYNNFGNGEDAEKTRKSILDYLEGNDKLLRDSIREYATQDRKHWAQILKDTNKDPSIPDDEKKKLNEWVRSNAPSIGRLFRYRLKGESDAAIESKIGQFTSKPQISKVSEGKAVPTPKKKVPTSSEGRSLSKSPSNRLPKGRSRGGGVVPIPPIRNSKGPEGVGVVKRILKAIKELFLDLAKGTGDDSLLERNLRRLANKLPKERRDKILKRIDKAFPKKPDIAHKGPQNLKELLAASKKVMAPYEKSLKSAASLSRRGESLVSRLEERIKNVPRGSSEYVRLSNSISNARSKAARADDRLTSIMSQIQEDMKKTNLTGDEVKGLIRGVRIVGNTPDSLSVKRSIVGYIEDFIKMFNGLGVSKVEGEGRGNVGRSLSKIAISQDLRAHANPSSGTVSITPYSKGDAFHEMAHLMGRQRPWLEKMLSDWRDSRAFSRDEIKNELVSWRGGKVRVAEEMRTPKGNIPLIKLKDIEKGYDSGELAVADRFISPYMGKVYKSGTSEVLSMAVQHFVYPWDMARMYKAHPDLFNVVVGLSAQ